MGHVCWIEGQRVFYHWSWCRMGLGVVTFLIVVLGVHLHMVSVLWCGNHSQHLHLWNGIFLVTAIVHLS